MMHMALIHQKITDQAAARDSGMSTGGDRFACLPNGSSAGEQRGPRRDA